MTDFELMGAALEEARKDPLIHEIVDLFGGEVVDIHK